MGLCSSERVMFLSLCIWLSCSQSPSHVHDLLLCNSHLYQQSYHIFSHNHIMSFKAIMCLVPNTTISQSSIIVSQSLINHCVFSICTPCVCHGKLQLLQLMDLDIKPAMVHQITIKKRRRITTRIYGRTVQISMLKKYIKGKRLHKVSYD